MGNIVLAKNAHLSLARCFTHVQHTTVHLESASCFVLFLSPVSIKFWGEIFFYCRRQIADFVPEASFSTIDIILVRVTSNVYALFLSN